MFALLLTMSLIALLAYYFASYHLDSAHPHWSGGPNALWVGHAWVGDPHSESEYAAFAGLLERERISDIFVHVGPLDADGRIAPDRYPSAMDLLRHLSRADPQLRVQAWIGQIEAKAGGPLDLSNERVRTEVVATANGFLRLGFGGIHYDIEPVSSGDPEFLDLLQRTQALTRQAGAMLSVSAPDLDPLGAAGGFLRRHVSSYGAWRGGYYRQVAGLVDQIAVMTYGKQFPVGWMYGSFVRLETGRILRLLGSKTTLFIGVPTYDVVGWGILHHSETISSGLRGVQEGLAGANREDLQTVGVALYAEWTTDPSEWREYEETWLPGGAADGSVAGE